MKAFSLGASLVAMAAADTPDYKAMWEQYKKDYNKEFPANGNDEEKRFNVFKDNVDVIETTNAKELSYKLGLNEFADLTWDEFASTHLGYKSSGPSFGNLPKVPFPNITDVADAVDWVEKGAVTPVKNQAHCGSCWAFSSTGSIEGGMFVATGKLISLSEEDLVQCDHNQDHGCRGGWMDHAFEWVAQNGISTESSYPYTSGGGATGTCKSGRTPAVTLTGHTDVPSGDENALKAAVSKQPVSIAIEADKSAFQLYKSGILDDASCGKQLDHGVLVVGYGTEGGKDYWKVKNSWGATWGDHGYIRMVRGKNQCGLATAASYPTGVKAASPSPPSPPSSTHYEDPKGGCRSDEVDISIQGIPGSVCAPSCGFFTRCPTDVPTGVTVMPQCALQDSSTNKRYCALICDPSAAEHQCGRNASCKSIGGTGLCTYDDVGITAAKEHVVYDGHKWGIVV